MTSPAQQLIGGFLYSLVMDELIGRLLELNCPYLNPSESRASHAKWMKGLSAKDRDEERSGFLRWILTNSSAGLSSMPLEESLVAIGLFTSKEKAKSFLGGSGGRGEAVWRQLLSLLLPQHNQDTSSSSNSNSSSGGSISSREQLLAELRNQAEFKDAVAGEVCLGVGQEGGVGGYYRPLGYQLERELRTCPAPTFQPPSRQILQSLLARGQQERDTLQQQQQEQRHLAETRQVVDPAEKAASSISCPLYSTSPPSSSAGAQEEEEEESRLLAVSCTSYEALAQQLRGQFAARLEPLLRRRQHVAVPSERHELARCAEASAQLRCLLDAQSAICRSVHSWRDSADRLADLENSRKSAIAALPAIAALTNSL